MPRYVVIRVDRDPKDTHAAEIRDGETVEAAISKAIAIAIPDQGSTLEYAVVTASDAGAARLMGSGWQRVSAGGGAAPRVNPSRRRQTAAARRLHRKGEVIGDIHKSGCPVILGKGEPWEQRSIIIVNANDRSWTKKRFVLWFGMGAPTMLMAYANSLDDALDECVDWLAEHAPGLLANEHVADKFTQLQEEGMGFEEARDKAEEDTTQAGNHGDHLMSGEWGLVAENPTRAQIFEIVGGKSSIRGGAGRIERARPARGNPRCDEDEILHGMAKAIWVTSFANWCEEVPSRMRKHGPGPGGDWVDVVDDPPASAEQAAADMAEAFREQNGVSMADLCERATGADGKNANSENFGHYMAMQAMGHGVSWFDDHRTFPVRFPRHFEAYSPDGKTVEWSPRSKAPRASRKR
jgi:hypothetical protein